MSQFARVESVDALRGFRAVLAKFSESARSALSDAEGELQRTLIWVQNEQRTYWLAQVQKRHQAVLQAREAVRQKLLYRTDLSSKDSAAEEKKALSIALRAFEEAERKVTATKAWGQKLAQEAVLYRGLAQRMANQADIRVPEAMARLERTLTALEAYLKLEAPETAAAPGAPGGTGIGPTDAEAAASETTPSMARGGEAPEPRPAASGGGRPSEPKDAKP